eukprot:jgi/Chlat1/124/Chrsp1S03219
MTTEVEAAVLAACRKHANGVADSVLAVELSDVDVSDRVAAINSLLASQLLRIFKQGDTLVYKGIDQDEAVRFKGLSSEDMLVYQLIQRSGNMGIWTKDMKIRSNLQQPQITKILKTLEGRKLVKAVKSVASKNRKVYMAFEVEPSREITGGAWYTEQEFDAEFIGVLMQQCSKYINAKGTATLADLHQFVKSTGLSKIELSQEDVLSIINTLIFDGKVEELTSTGPGDPNVPKKTYPRNTVFYRPARTSMPETTAFTSLPCGICTVFDECTPDGIINPSSCEYYQQWLEF